MKFQFCFLLPVAALFVVSPALAEGALESQPVKQLEQAAHDKDSGSPQPADAAKAEDERLQMLGKRKYLGAAANGKTDAEVNILYDAKIKSDAVDAYNPADKGNKGGRGDAQTGGRISTGPVKIKSPKKTGTTGQGGGNMKHHEIGSKH